MPTVDDLIHTLNGQVPQCSLRQTFDLATISYHLPQKVATSQHLQLKRDSGGTHDSTSAQIQLVRFSRKSFKTNSRISLALSTSAMMSSSTGKRKLIMMQLSMLCVDNSSSQTSISTRKSAKFTRRLTLSSDLCSLTKELLLTPRRWRLSTMHQHRPLSVVFAVFLAWPHTAQS